MSKQPEALRLAERLGEWGDQGDLLEAAAELRQLHEENDTLRIANEAFGRRQEWWDNRMFDMEQRYMALVKSVADGQALQRPNITLTTDEAKDTLLRQALMALKWAERSGTTEHGGDEFRKQTITAIRQHLGDRT